ncbi:protease IV [Thermotomaculum hydrothermale]|uniref:Protease IV n=1 Tax=Thermotomaculum hydrothermale TaxID=981385 RepID=A0A7R6PL49_9BACT|nr:signal peptide peptidase SppA [Thermotomaculum hydrothermale]BBB32122.1 protease IV [Thermotomaculum hydrothermale]
MAGKAKKTILILIIIFVFFVGVVYFIGKTLGKFYSGVPTISNNTLVEVRFKNPVPEREPLIPFKKTIPFHKIIKALYTIPADSRVNGVLVFGNELPLDIAQLEELRTALENIVKSGKKVYVYYDQIGMNYFLVPKGAKVVMHPTPGSYVSLRGYYSAQPFFRTLLEEKLGIKFNVIHIGNYKGAGEPFVRDSMSKYLRQELTELFESFWNNICSMISESRGFNKEEFQKKLYDGKYFSISKEEAKKAGLVDMFEYKQNIEDKYDSVIEINKYAKSISDGFGTKPIALIVAEGEIVMGEEEPSLLGNNKNVIAADTMCDIIRRAADNDNVKVIVFRVNSPGGSALASELINRELKRAAKKKPVIVSVGYMAASGGYYISCGGDYIIADKNSIVGSIGVVSLIPEITELSKKIGVHFDEIKKGKYSDFLSPFKKITPDEEELLRKDMLDIYGVFKQRVADARKLDLNYVESIAQGRIYSGTRGLQIKLVDKIGTLHDALLEAKKRANLKSIDYTEFSAKKSLFELLQEDFGTKTSIETILNKKIKSLFKLCKKPMLIDPALIETLSIEE